MFVVCKDLTPSSREGDPSRAKCRLVRKVLRPAGIVIALAALAFAFRSVDFAKAGAIVAGIGPAVIFVVVPAFVALNFDASAWRALLRLARHELPLASLVRARFSAEAVALTIPGGPLAAEALKPKLLHNLGVPLRDGIATVGARKVGVLATNAAYIAAAIAIGHTWMPFPVMLALGGAALVLAFTSSGLYFTGRKLHPIFGVMRSRWFAIVSPLAAAWMLEAAETFIVLRLIGVDASLGFVLAMEVSVSVLRNVAAFAPAGIGFSDAGYATWLAHLAVADPASTAAAFVLLKRAKDLCVVAIGYALVLRSSRPRVGATSPDGERSRVPLPGSPRSAIGPSPFAAPRAPT